MNEYIQALKADDAMAFVEAIRKHIEVNNGEAHPDFLLAVCKQLSIRPYFSYIWSRFGYPSIILSDWSDSPCKFPDAAGCTLALRDFAQGLKWKADEWNRMASAVQVYRFDETK